MHSSVRTKLKKDPIMANIIENVILPDNTSSGIIYHDLIRSITGQQLSVRVAQVIFNRLVNLYGGMIPTPHQLHDTEHETLRSVGYSNQKANYIRNVASFFLERGKEYEEWSQYSDEEVMKELIQIKGVGKWTVEMVLMFTLERPDVMPVDDLGIQMGMKHFYGLTEEKRALKVKMLEISEQWRPYRTYACRWIWAAKDNNNVALS